MLTWLGVISPFSKFESSVSNDIENKLRVEADAGDADKQNKLGTLLYTQAKRQNSDFSDAIYWFKNAAKQDLPL
ncbi:MAG: hypothetical protein JKX87_03860 [Cycloclasticus sp.]|nr:hypothetical protein [Cycloclasticus sp.]